MKTQSNELPKTRRWQEGYEIPVNIEELLVEKDDQTYIAYSYNRVVVSALTVPDIESAVAREFNADADVLAQALQSAKSAII